MPVDRVFLDTNIWLYAFMQGSPPGRRDVAAGLISKLCFPDKIFQN